MYEKTLVIIKPDGVHKGLIGTIIKRLEEFGTITTLRMGLIRPEGALEFYEEHKGKEFYDRLTAFMASSKVVLIRLEGENVVAKVREEIGATDPNDADPRSIRGMFGSKKITHENVVHASDSPKSAKRELKFFFTDEK